MRAELSRRSFLQFSLASGGLLITTSAIADEPKDRDYNHQPQLTPLAQLKSDNTIIFYYPSPEMGQGTDTSLAMLFAEELGADFDLISVKPMKYMITRDEEGEIKPVAVPQFAGGSTSIPRNYPLIREAGARCREMLLLAAAKQLSIPKDQLTIDNSFIVNSSKQRYPIAQFLEAASKIELDDDFSPELKAREHWQVSGHAKPGKQVRDIITGQPLYAMDQDYPGAKIALLARAPKFDAEIKSVDDRAALKLPGVHAVVQLPRPALDKYYTYLAAGVAVLADDFWTAKKARDLLKIKWSQGPWSDESTTSLDNQCRDLLKTKGQIVRQDGDFDGALKRADKVFTRTYELPLVSHAQLEPQNCIAHVEKNKCTIIGPLQSPGGASRMASELTGLDRLDINIEYARLGGGFGRRLQSDHVAEAVMISKLSGMPVKLIWTREDDMAHDFYRPMGHHQMKAGVDSNGKLTAWTQRLAGTPKHYRRNGKKAEEMYDADLYIDDFPAGLIPNLQLEYWAAASGAPQGSWRAPAHTANAFVIQSFLDEIIRELGEDPLQYRLDLLGKGEKLAYGGHGGPNFDTARMKQVLIRAAKMSGWNRELAPGHGLGLAGHFTFGGYCAQVAEVALNSSGGFRVKKVFAAIDVGTVINPAGIAAQVEGGINDGLSTALGQKVQVEGGEVVSTNFDTYPMARIVDSVPNIEVEIIESSEPPSGAGEMGIAPLAPAVANAVVAAGGPRFRSQPFRS